MVDAQGGTITGMAKVLYYLLSLEYEVSNDVGPHNVIIISLPSTDSEEVKYHDTECENPFMIPEIQYG
jgi:hypothetical protein